MLFYNYHGHSTHCNCVPAGLEVHPPTYGYPTDCPTCCHTAPQGLRPLIDVELWHSILRGIPTPLPAAPPTYSWHYCVCGQRFRTPEARDSHTYTTHSYGSHGPFPDELAHAGGSYIILDLHTGNILKHRAVRLPTPGIAGYNSTHGECETWRIAMIDVRALPLTPTKGRFFLTTDSQSTESTVHTMVEQQPTLSASHKSPMAQISISMRSAYLAARHHTPVIIKTSQYNKEHNRTHDDDSIGDPSLALIINANAINDLAAKRASTYVDYDAVIPPPVDGPAPPYPPTDFGAAADTRGSPGGPGMGTKVYYSFKGVKIDVPPRDLAHRIAAEEQAAFLRESPGTTSDTARLLHAGRLSRTVASKIAAQLTPHEPPPLEREP